MQKYLFATVASVAIAAAAAIAPVAQADAATITIVGPTGFTASAGAAAPVGSGAVVPFGPGGAVGGLTTGLITFTDVAEMLTITVQDCCLVGDVFEVVVDGTSLGLTTPVPLNGPTNSSGTFSVAVAAGTHTVGIEDITLSYLGASSPFGGGVVPLTFSPAGLTVTITSTTVPEPASMALLGTALIGFGAAARRRKPDTANEGRSNGRWRNLLTGPRRRTA